MEPPLAVVIMAAGKGTRMNNPAMAKVMYTIADKPMVEHVVDLAHALHAERVVAIVGWQKDSVIDHLRATGKKVECVEQNPQLGNGPCGDAGGEAACRIHGRCACALRRRSVAFT